MASIKYFGPGGQSVTLGSESDKWAGLNATDASIDSFKSKGNASTPVYFDENGVPQAVTETSSSEAEHAGTADRLKTARTISLTGDATGSASFDGSGDVSIDVSVSGGSGGSSGARVVVYVPLGAVVTCTDSTGTEVGSKTAETEAMVTFDLSYGTYTFSTPTDTSGAVDSETISITELKMYYTSLDNGEAPTPEAYILRVITEPSSVITVTTGDAVQTKVMGGSDSSVHFTIPDTTVSSTVSITKNGATRTETVSFDSGSYGKTVSYTYAKLNVTGRTGQTIVISKDSYSYTTVMESSTDEYTVYVPEFGTWSVIATGSDGEITRKTCAVSAYKDYYVSCATKLFAFKIDGTVSDPAKMITYLEENKNFTPAKMNYNTNKFDWGSWDSNEFFIPRPCMLKYDGTVDYYLNENNYALRADTGEDSDISNPDYQGNAMMEWGRYGKKIWYKIVPSGDSNTSATVYIADYQADSSYHAWSFINSSGEMVDHFYTPIYNGTVINSKLRSLSEQTPTRSTTVTQEVQYAEANNPSSKKMWYTEVYADVTLINLLLMLLGRSTDTQTTFGYGNGSGSVQNTGQLDTYGMFYGTQSADLKGVKVFGMENWWGNVYRRYAGHVTNSNRQQLVKLTYGTQDGSSTTGYNTTGSGYLTSNATPSANVSGYSTQYMYNNSHGMLPYAASSGSASTYYCDYTWIYNGAYYAVRGGHCGSGTVCGAFCVYLHYSASIAGLVLGAAISCKPC